MNLLQLIEGAVYSSIVESQIFLPRLDKIFFSLIRLAEKRTPPAKHRFVDQQDLSTNNTNCDVGPVTSIALFSD